MQRLSSQSSWRSLFRNRLKHTQSALPFEFLSEITRPRHEASIKQSSSSSTKNRPLPNLEDLLALRPRLKRQRRRTDSEWAQEYARKFQAGIGSLERAFTLPQLEHLAEQLELQVQGRHTSYRKRDIATQLVRSDQGWGWHDPQVLLDKIKRKSNAPLHKLDMDLSPAELFLSWPTVHRVGATHNVHSKTLRTPGQPASHLHLEGAKEDVDSVEIAVKNSLKTLQSFQVQLPASVRLSDEVLKKVSLQSLVYIEKTSSGVLECSCISPDQGATAERILNFLVHTALRPTFTPIFSSASQVDAHRFALLPATLTTQQGGPWWEPAGLRYRVSKLDDTAQMPFWADIEEEPQLRPVFDAGRSIVEALLQSGTEQTFTATFGQLSTTHDPGLPSDTLARTLDLAAPLTFASSVPERFLQLSGGRERDRAALAAGPTVRQLKERMRYYRTKSSMVRRRVYLAPTPSDRRRLVIESAPDGADAQAYIETYRAAWVSIPDRPSDLELDTSRRTTIRLNSEEASQLFITWDQERWSLAQDLDVRETRVLDPTTSSSAGAVADSATATETQPFDWLIVQTEDRLLRGTSFATRTQCLQLRLAQATTASVLDSIAMVHALR